MRTLLPLSAGRVRLAVAVAVSCAAIASMSATSSAAGESHSIGDRYLDGLDSRHSASAIAQMASKAGYTATAAGDGRTADNAWNEALNSSLFGFFGHANAGVLQVKDRTGTDSDEFLGAGMASDLLPLYANYRFFTEFVPYVDVDDMRLAILAGCYTANTHPSLGDFEDVARSRGVDATVAFPGLVYFPTKCTDCVYSGNYFWDRFAVHYGSGATLTVSLSRARTDLVNKEGNGGGWGSYRITGSVAAPGSTKLRPRGDGAPLTSQPLGTSPYTMGSLTVTGVRALPDGQVEQTTQEGVLIRRDAADQVIDVWAPSATSGESFVPTETLRATSHAFVTDVAGDHDWTLAADEEVFHHEEERLHRFTWRLDTPVPQVVDVEVDRRTGAVTYLARATAPHATRGTHVVTAAEAEQIALADIGADVRVMDVEQFTWGGPLWVVRTRDDNDRDPLGAKFQEVTVDGITGDIVRRTTT